MKKICIIGCAGSGKTTLAIALSRKLDIPAFHLDSYYWKPNWTESPKGEWRMVQESLCDKERWILDGHYGGTLDLRFAHCDTVVFLDYNRTTCLLRALKRSLKYLGKTRLDMASGCKERIDFKFYRWIFNFPKNSHPIVMQQLESLPDSSQLITLKSQADLDAFFEETLTLKTP